MTMEVPTGVTTPAPVWLWRYVDPEGRAASPELVSVAGESPRFSSQADAESWVGEYWRDLLGAGVDAVTLEADGVDVYGPMSLQPPTD